MNEMTLDIPSQAEEAEVVKELYGIMGFHVGLAYTALKQHFQQNYKNLQLTQKQIAILWLIGGCPGIIQSSLGRWLGVERTTIAAMVRLLTNKGLVTKHAAGEDSRLVPLSLTPKGEEELAQAKAAIAEHEAELLEGVGKADVGRTIAVLRQIHGG